MQGAEANVVLSHSGNMQVKYQKLRLYSVRIAKPAQVSLFSPTSSN